MIRNLAILTGILLMLNYANGQIPNLTDQKQVDSMVILLPLSDGETKVDLLNHLSMQIAPLNVDSGFYFAGKALALSEQLNYPKGEGIATFNLGNSYFFKSDIKNALINYLKALRMLEPLEPAKEIGDLYLMLGSINEYVRNTGKLSEYYHLSAKNYYAVGDTAAAMLAYLVLGSSFYYKFQTLSDLGTISDGEVNTLMDSAIRYNKIVLDYYLKPHQHYEWMSKEAWLANIYNYYGCYYSAKGDSMALDYYLKALEKSREIDLTYDRNFFEGLLCSNLGDYYYFRKNSHEKGFQFSQRALTLLKQTQRYDIYAGSLLLSGQIELDTDNFNNAEKYLFLSISLSDTFITKINQIPEPDPTFRLWGITQIRHIRAMAFGKLVQLYELKSDLQKALFYQKKLEAENQIQIRDELNRQIMGLQINHENEMRDEQLNLLTKENALNRMKFLRTRSFFVGFAGFAVLSGLILLLLYQKKKMKSEQKALILEQKLLRSQMNPHFLFNSLTSIQNFIVGEKPDKASIYLSKFSKLVRNILDNSVEEYVPLEKEISTIENYIELQKVRWAGKFDYCIKIALEIDDENTLIPPMLAQPFIENAIEHGVKHRETPGFIDIRFTRSNHSIILEVEDNGVGREKAREYEMKSIDDHRSMATSITKERLIALNKKNKHKITLHIADLKNEMGEGIGTHVTFGIPIRCLKS